MTRMWKRHTFLTGPWLVQHLRANLEHYYRSKIVMHDYKFT